MSQRQVTLEGVVGPMWAGKTTEQLRLIRQYELCQESVCVIKHSSDDRHPPSELMRSHDGLAPNEGAITQQVHTDTLADLQIDDSVALVVIDEVQFFEQQTAVQFCRDMLARNKEVRFSGLDMDFRMEPWETTSALMAIADKVKKLKARCRYPGCKTPAGYTARIVSSKERQVVGAEKQYAASCRAHHPYLSYKEPTTPVSSPREETDVEPLRKRPTATAAADAPAASALATMTVGQFAAMFANKSV